jgi:hypothetical protein
MATEVTTILLDIIARDKASKQLLTSGLAVGALGLAIGRFAKDSIAAYEESEAAQNRLALAYQKFPKLADVSLASLKALADETEKKTIYDHNATMASEAVLAQFGLTGQQIETLIPLVQDLASSQGEDLMTATEGVGKAFLGSTKALKSAGIEFKATHNEVKDFATIQADLNAKVGGFADVQGKSAAGQAAILRNEFHLLEESVGGALVPAMVGLEKVLIVIVDAFNALPAPVKDAALAVGAVTVAGGIVIPMIARLKVALVTLGLVGRTTGGELGAVAAGESLISARAATAMTALKGIGVVGGAAATILTLGFINVVDILDKAGQATSDFKDANGNMASEVKVATDILSQMPSAIQHITDPALWGSVQPGIDTLNKLGVSVDQVITAAKGSQATWQAFSNGVNNAAIKAGVGDAADQQLATSLDDVRNAIVAAGPPTTKQTAAVTALGNATKNTAVQIQTAYKQIEDATIRAYDFKDANDTATASIVALGKNSHEKAADVRSAMRDILNAADAAAGSVTSVKDKDIIYRQELGNLEKTTRPGSPLRLALDAYIAKLDGIRSTINTTLTVTVPPSSVRAIQTLLTDQKLLRHGAASGGWQAGSTMVGEYGPELVRLPHGSRVYSASQSTGSGGVTLNIVNNYAPGANSADIVKAWNGILTRARAAGVTLKIA